MLFIKYIFWNYINIVKLCFKKISNEFICERTSNEFDLKNRTEYCYKKIFKNTKTTKTN